MNITFIYSDKSLMNSNRFNRGVAILSAGLKRAGFNTSLIHISSQMPKDEFINSVKNSKPDILAYSYQSLQFKNILPYIEWSNELNILTIHGGMHPTVDPEECFQTGKISILCRGEGDLAMVEFCEKVRDGKAYTGVENFSFLIDNKIVSNSIRPILENMDDLPYMDYEIFNYENLRESLLDKELVFQASRGCYYDCTYCCNHLQKSLIPNKKKYLRSYSVERVMSEIKRALDRYPFIKKITFDDDTLTQNKVWFTEFADKYKNEIALSYTCNDRVNNITEEVAGLLKESGCTQVTMGIESGNEHMRRDVMKRPISEKQIIQAFFLLKKHSISTGAFNIIGMPGETSVSVLDTIRLNAKVSPDKTYNAYFYPFHGTEAYKKIIAEKIPVKSHSINDFFSSPVIGLNTISESEIIFFYRYFILLREVVKKIMALPAKFSSPLIQIYEAILKHSLFPCRILIFLFPGRDQVVNWLQQYKFIYKPLRAVKKMALG